MQVLSEEMARGLPTVSPYSTGLDGESQTMEEAFPPVKLDFRPFGTRIVVQLKRVLSKSKGGILLDRSTKDTEAWNTQIGKVLAMGPLAFKNRGTGAVWPEGMWAEIGQFVRFARHVGDRYSHPAPEDGGDPIPLLILNDADLIGEYLGDPRTVRAFLL